MAEGSKLGFSLAVVGMSSVLIERNSFTPARVLSGKAKEAGEEGMWRDGPNDENEDSSSEEEDSDDEDEEVSGSDESGPSKPNNLNQPNLNAKAAAPALVTKESASTGKGKAKGVSFSGGANHPSKDDDSEDENDEDLLQPVGNRDLGKAKKISTLGTAAPAPLSRRERCVVWALN